MIKKTLVINPLSNKELNGFLDEKAREIIKYFIIKSLFSQPESKLNQKSLPIQIPKEHIEQWFTQALDVKSVGAGSYPIDIYNERDKWGADIKMLNIKLDKKGDAIGDSGEASLGQKFEGVGVHLDSLFKSKNFDSIKDKWIELYKEKYFALKNNYPIERILYFFILRPSIQTGGTDFFFAGASVDLSSLKNVKVNKNRTTMKSVFLNNFIDENYGNTKIYKAKKRMELRLRPNMWIKNNMVIRISTSFNGFNVDLRNEKLGSEYLAREIEKIKSININFIE
jgi:hypothetical protein